MTMNGESVYCQISMLQTCRLKLVTTKSVFLLHVKMDIADETQRYIYYTVPPIKPTLAYRTFQPFLLDLKRV